MRWIFLILIPVIAFSTAHHIEVESYDGEVLRLSVFPMYRPDWIRVVLITQKGVIFPSKVEGNEYEFKVSGSDYAIVSVQGFSEEYGPLNKAKPLVLDLKSLSYEPDVYVLSDIKEDGVYGYVTFTKGDGWKVERVEIDGRELKWFDWKGKGIAFFREDLEDGMHELKIFYSLPYGLKRTVTKKLFSLKGVLTLYRGRTYPYKVEYVEPYTYVVKRGETLWEIANRFGVRLADLILINDIKNPDRLVAGTFLRIGRVHFEKSPAVVVINLFTARMGLYYDGKLVKVYPVALGRSDSTPPGEYSIIRKVINPPLYWYGEYIPPGIPLNGLGTRYLQLSNPQYAIHGTSKPWEIGKRISHGCVRMFNHDVEELDAFVPIGTKVIVIKRPGDFPEDLEGVLR